VTEQSVQLTAAAVNLAGLVKPSTKFKEFNFVSRVARQTSLSSIIVEDKSIFKANPMPDFNSVSTSFCLYHLMYVVTQEEQYDEAKEAYNPSSTM
jgi:hypothetical protein